MLDFSICIPTYNRAEHLRRCLAHLAGFSDLSFEIVIGNNASTDDTEAAIQQFKDAFPHFLYVNRPNNVGFARNMDALLRQATRKYVYILNDDDIVFKSALDVSAHIMDTNPGVVAVVGEYLSLRKLDPGIEIDYQDATASVIEQGAHFSLLNNLSICDGHPIIRREVFERHCTYLDRTGTLIPLYFTLLNHGHIVSVNKPFFQHLTNSESLTSRMAEAWFIDMANADLEIAISGALSALPPDALATARQRLLQLLYYQAARMSISKKSPYILWLFLRRLLALGGTPEDLFIKCEYHFVHDFVMERIATILQDRGARKIGYLPTASVCAVIEEIGQTIPDLRAIELSSADDIADADFVILEQAQQKTPEMKNVIALVDLLNQFRLTRHPGRPCLLQGRMTIQYTEQAAIDLLRGDTPSFRNICAPYSSLN
jgi:hypothetical protein